jgi:hypothetical protein
MMTWGRREHDETVAQEFRRALHRSAEDHVVAEAERMVRGLWLAELVRLQVQLKSEYDQAHDARAAAWTAVHDRRRADDKPGLARAQHALGESNADLCRCAEAERVLAQIAAEERELMSRADEECELVATANRIRVRTAWDEMRAVWAKQPSHAPARGRGGF